jgi:hypothetical protein
MIEYGSAPQLLTSLKPDAVYFLMLEGWRHELRSNRWHYAKRWARHLPVILLQPTQVVASRRSVSREDGRIANCRILEIKSSRSAPSYLEDTLVQLGQVTHDMEEHGVKRPLLWFYNPYLTGLYAALPAVGRIMHATENYFHFDGLPELVLDRYRVAIRISDMVVAVSEGVAASVREKVPGAHVVVVTNGCDYKEYSAFTPSRELIAAKGTCQLTAIYAGNINNRLDYALIQRCVKAFRDVCFAFFGPVVWLSGDDARRWNELIHEPNLRYFGTAGPDLLPGLYGAADVGLIPYKRSRFLVENGFPLKALEMCATGLPVVSTFMRPIEGLMDELAVVRDDDSFVRTLGRMSRSALSEAQLEKMRRVCQQHDYDLKFRTVLDTAGMLLGDQREPETRWDAVVHRAHATQWMQLGAREWRLSRTVAARLRAAAIRAVNRLAQLGGGSGVLERLDREPRSATAKGILTLRLVMADGALRRLLWEYAKDRQVQRKVGMTEFLADVLRFGIVRSHRSRRKAGSSGFEVEVHYEPADGRLSFVSVRHERGGRSSSMGGCPVSKAGKLREIVWDHSAIDHTVAWTRSSGDRLSVYLGPNGIYEFVAIEALARRHEDAIWRAVMTRVADA